ncbi:MAG: hypothetical protein KBC84_05560 [Proteobacteria bacterium]|nr:hypothetical protein [Pseudomonadota bacterium]
MSEELISKLLESFNELDNCIEHTKSVLAKRAGVPNDVLARVNQYSDIVLKQRSLTEDLRKYLDTQNWDEVTRHVKLINGLSSMIRDDAQSILSISLDAEAKVKPEVLV